MIFKPQVQSFPRLAAPSNVIWNSPLEDKQAILREACAHYEPENQAKCFCINSKIFQHDSAWATVAVGKRHRNPGNMRCPKHQSDWFHNMTCARHEPSGPWASYPTLEDGIWGNVALYNRLYKGTSAQFILDNWVQTAEKPYEDALKSCF